jgi:hypothetical protein
MKEDTDTIRDIVHFLERVGIDTGIVLVQFLMSPSSTYWVKRTTNRRLTTP